jgi:hypothetical protein
MAFEATIGRQAATSGPRSSFQARIPVNVILPCMLVEKEPNIIQNLLILLLSHWIGDALCGS